MQNQTMMQSFHWYSNGDGNFWKDAAAQATVLASLGINAVWLPPACKGSEGITSNGYDLYDLFDLGEFDQKGTVRTKFGTMSEYIRAIKTFHRHKIKVYADIILNHKAGADSVEKVLVRTTNPENRNEFTSDPFIIDAYTIFRFPGRKKKYSAFNWDSKCFSGVDYAAGTNQTAIFKIENKFGRKWDEVVGDEKGNFDFLMYADIEFRNPAVRRELRHWGRWYLNITGIDGLRLDAVKHMSPSFINAWLDYVRKNRPGLFAVGEYWAPGDLPLLKRYIDATGSRMSLFDAALHYNFYEASVKEKDYDLRKIFDNTLVSAFPSMAVTIVDNHDTQPLQEMDSFVKHWFKPIAYALVLLRKDGYPCVFCPDLYGAVYKEIVLDKCTHIEKLLLVRANYAYGLQRDYFDHPNCIGWTRQGIKLQKGSGCAVVLSNAGRGMKKMKMGKRHAGRTFIDLLGNITYEVVINRAGWAVFFSPARGLSVWIEKK